MLLGVSTQMRSAVTTDGFELPSNYTEYEWYIVPEEYRGVNFGVQFLELESGVKPILMVDGTAVDDATVESLKQQYAVRDVITLAIDKTNVTTNDSVHVTVLKNGQPITEPIEIAIYEHSQLVAMKAATELNARFVNPGKYKFVVATQNTPYIAAQVTVNSPTVEIF